MFDHNLAKNLLQVVDSGKQLKDCGCFLAWSTKVNNKKYFLITIWNNHP